MSTPTLGFMLRHPAHVVALGFGSGLAPRAPGTAGTLAAWGAFWLLERQFGPLPWAALLPAGLLLGVWACTRCAQHMNITDPGAIVWDEVLAFVLFRFFDAAKPGPVGWADRLFKPAPGAAIGWQQGFGILFDDLVAAACTLLLMLPTRALWS